MFGGKGTGKGKDELFAKMLSGNFDMDDLAEMDPMTASRKKNQQAHQGTREERIACHMESVKDCQKLAKSQQPGRSTIQATSSSYERKTATSDVELSDLTPLTIKQLQVGQVHHSHVLYCHTITPCTAMQSIMTLIEDSDGELAQIAVYNTPSVRSLQAAQRYLPKGRAIAIKEPFFKMRADGTLGIRIDDPKEVVFDVELPTAVSTTLEDRLAQLVREDKSVGKKKLREALQAEGYTVSLKRVQELMSGLRDEQGDEADNSFAAHATCPTQSEGETGNTPCPAAPLQLPKRDPLAQRILQSACVHEFRDTGNEAIKAGKYAEAEKAYSKAIKAGRREDIGSAEVQQDGIQLWTLFSNRAAARLRLGLPDEALQDSLLAHCCAPSDVIKPVLRCAEAMGALCLYTELASIIQAAIEEFPNDAEVLSQKQRDLAPKATLRVGIGQKFTSIQEAVQKAPAGAEILVSPGVYRERLCLTKPVTIRSFDAVQPNEHWVHGAQPGEMVQIWVKGPHAISIITEGSVCLQGLRIVCEAAPERNFHAVEATSGVALLRNCSLSSSSGPILAADCGARVILEHCAVHDGGQGGLIAANGATLVLSKVFCSRAAASGLELRADGRAVVECSSFFANGRTGVFIWNGAGAFLAKDTEIHSNNFESGVLVCDNMKAAVFKSCKIYGNGSAGVAVQTKGLLTMQGCEVHSNYDGILIQSSGNATIEKCEVHTNRASGIFVGYDHVGSAQIVGNRVYENMMKGILLGTGRNKNVTVQDNVERGNRGLAPMGLPSQAGAPSQQHKAMDMREWSKNMQKSGGSAKKSAFATTEQTFVDKLFASGIGDQLEEATANRFLACGFCKKPQGTEKFRKCSKCLLVNYCSSECQAAHWKSAHKTECKPAPPKHPSFLDSSRSVDDAENECSLQ